MGILGELWVKLGLKSEGLNQGLDNSKKKVDSFSNYISKLGGIMAGAFSVQRIIGFSKEITELANKASGVRKAFNNLNSPTLLSELRQATQGTVDDLQLMQKAVQAKNFKLPLDQLSTYLKFASQRARETGESVDYLVDSIITGLGRQSVMILDNLGISAAEIRDNMKDGASMAEAVGKIISEQMKGAETEIDKAALATDRLTASWTNFKIALGSNETLQGAWSGIKSTITDALDFMSYAINDKNFNWYDFISMAGDSATAYIKQQQYLAKKRAEDAQIAEGEYGVWLDTNKGGATNTNTEVEAKKGLIPLLQEEIKKKEQLRDLSANEDEIRTINNEIAALQEKLKVMQMTNEEYLKYRNANSGIEPIPLVDEIFNITALTENKDAGLAIIDQAYQELAAKGEQMAELAIEQQTKINDIAEMMNQALAAGITSSLNELANVIAGVEDANAGTVIKSLLSPIADACITAGVLVMTSGKAIEALRESLKNFIGIPAIAAGAILVGIGVAAKAGLAAIGKNAGRTSAGASYNTGFSGGYGVVGGVNPYTFTQQQNSMVLTSTLKGQDLLLSIQRTEANNKR